ncbi:hypothetical protein CDLVIII_1320 [Clostridium sp. DL-VIII]|uniref:hypothetical protein n=1 Tax=Clostridium sp. DL-VIII TaxID=641107 RepID=UPI00023AF7B7|nr:hypothetical protein [Clostridium sp. DL-VIII]EHI98019.1 hypothetical protein CDLVIII_1320 [Clostridium sp. DL-VIII]
MYMLFTDKAHLTLEIRSFKGHLSPNDTKKVKEGKVVKFNMYHVGNKRKDLEELANKIKDQWIKETQELISKYRGLTVQLK